MKESLDIADIRNKLSPITTLISLLELKENDRVKVGYIDKAIEQSKKSINYLAQRKVYEDR
jgi:uncharacterized protein YecA (UPF0149 family)